MESEIRNHYNSDHLTQKIKTALAGTGKPLSELNLKDLSPIDQLHTGGAPASLNLFEKIRFSPGEIVLDAGCGIGGAARLLAKESQCTVIGIDLADRFIEAAQFLTNCTGLEKKVTFQQGSVLDLPFEDQTFDAVLCQHILMNIQNKPLAVREFFRVLKKGGKLILHEITKGENDQLFFPVPWAGKASISFLEPWDMLSDCIQKQGFITEYYSDKSREATAWWGKVKAFTQKRPPRPDRLGPGLVFGKNAAAFGQNMHAGFENNSICLVEAVVKKSYDE